MDQPVRTHRSLVVPMLLAAVLTIGVLLAFAVPARADDPSPGRPDEGYVAAPPVEYEHDSLTLDAVQVDPPATEGPEYPVEADTASHAANGDVSKAALGAAAVPVFASGGEQASGSSAVASPTGLLPFTGGPVEQVLVLALVLLGAGALGHLVGAAGRRPVHPDRDL